MSFKLNKIYRLMINIIIVQLLILFAIELIAAEPITLEKLKKSALINNAKIKNSNLEIESANELKSSMATKYLPTISMGAIGMRAAKPLIEMNNSGGNLPVYDGDPANLANAKEYAYMPGSKISLLDELFTANIMAAQPLYAGRRISGANDLAELNKEISLDKAKLSKNEVLLKTEQLFRQVLVLEEKYKTIKAFELFLDTIYKNVYIAYNAGLTTKNDLLKVGIKQKELSINKLKLGNGIELAKMALCQHTGVKYVKDLILITDEDDINSPETYLIENDKALASLVELSLMAKAVDAEEIQTQIKRGEYLPQLALGVTGLYNYVMDKSSSNAIAFVNLSVPISGFLESKHEMQIRYIKEQTAKNNEQDIRELMNLRINKAQNDLHEAYKQIALAEQLLKQSEQNLNENLVNYNSGLIKISDLLEARAVLQQSMDIKTNALADYKLAITNYLQATGRYE